MDASKGDEELGSGMWTSVSGAIAQAQSVDTVANNLANADTLGFKKDLPAFREYLAVREREPSAQDISTGPIKEKDLTPLDGRDQSFVVVDGTYTQFRQGNLKVTQSPLDVAMDGPGFIEVSTPSGIRFTRQGSLKISTEGRLVTPQGYPVLSSQPGGLAQEQTEADAARYIDLRDRGSHISISESGEIYAGDQFIAKLSVVEFNNLNKLRKTAGQLFENRDPQNISTGQTHTTVRQGVVETSNVNPVEEMTQLIKANRMFEHDMKALKTYQDIMGREANDIGKL